MKNYCSLNIRVRSDLFKYLKLFAAENEMTMTKIIEKHIEDLIEKNKKEVQK